MNLEEETLKPSPKEVLWKNFRADSLVEEERGKVPEIVFSWDEAVTGHIRENREFVEQLTKQI